MKTSLARAALFALTLAAMGGVASAATMPAAGSIAPNLTGTSVIGGKTEPFDLYKAATQRPVVLYFFIKAFTSG